jgi:YD repeat-containing protein
MTEVLGDAPLDVVENGAPVARPWWALVAITVLGAGALVVSSHARTAPVAKAAPSPSVSLVPLETIAPLPDPPLGNLPAPHDFLDAPPADSPMTLTIRTVSAAYVVDTVDDSQRTLYSLTDNKVAHSWTRTPGGWVAAVDKEALEPDEESRPVDVTFHTSRGTTHVSAPAGTYVVHGGGDTVWLARAQDKVRQYTSSGQPRSGWRSLPKDSAARAALPDGRLLLVDYDGASPATWRPGERARPVPGGGIVLAVDGYLLVTAEPCSFPDPRCTTHVRDLTTGSTWSTDVTRGSSPESAVASPYREAVALVTARSGGIEVVVARRGAPPVTLATLPSTDGGLHRFHVAWSEDGRLALLEDDSTTQVAYAWDPDGGLMRLGTYQLWTGVEEFAVE